MKYLAFYLPQFHPIPENDLWYGKGFTEWTNVGRAKPLFKGHYQPHVPADLGYYDLRLESIISEQIKLAKEFGIDGFCYWHYWFGNGKQLLEKPFKKLLKNKSLEFSFSLAWANASWEKKSWDHTKQNELIVKQEYLGKKDIYDHFYALLPAFQDSRYTRVDGKLLFLVHYPLDCPYMSEMIDIWNELAQKEGLKGFFFVGKDFSCRNKEKILNLGFESIYDLNTINIHHNLSKFNKIRLYIERKIFKIPTRFKYKDAIKYMVIEEDYEEDVFPVVAPNWDHSPRSGRNSIILTDAKPKYFYEVLCRANDCISKRNEEKKIVFICAWNEWGEGNHLEPDLEYGLDYLKCVKRAKQRINKIK